MWPSSGRLAELAALDQGVAAAMVVLPKSNLEAALTAKK